MESIQTSAAEHNLSVGAENILLLIGRILLAAPFLPSGLGKIFGFEQTAQMMAAEGMPLTTFFLAGAIFLELVGGLSLLLGFKASWGALLLIVFLIPATLIFHDFWTFSDSGKQMQEITQFLKNLGIMGGLFAIAACGAGKYSLDKIFGSKRTGE